MQKCFFLLAITFLLAMEMLAQSANTVVADNDTCRNIDAYLSTLASGNNFSGGLLIVKDGNLIFSKGYGCADKEKKIAFTPGTLASIGSITKAFTAAAIMKLVEQKKLSLDDPLKKFFPSAPADKSGITIHQLLTHSAGFTEFLKNDGGDYEVINKEVFLKRAFEQPLAFTPGEKAVYTNVGFSILGILIEQISGQDYEQFLTDNLFRPLNINTIGYHYPTGKNDTIAAGYQNGKRWGTHQEHFAAAGGGPYWNLKANGGLEASLVDMLKWVNAFTNYTVLSKASIEKMFSPMIAEEGYNGDFYFGYGCNISKSRRNTPMISNGGSNGIYFARIVRLPKEGLVFYMVTNESSANTNLVLPNVTQLYFNGKIGQDAFELAPKFENPLSGKVYTLLQNPSVTDLGKELENQKMVIEDDMILLEAGQRLTEENKLDKALILYKYYTEHFPQIVVAWNDMGEIYLARNNKGEAKKCFEQALKIRPGNPRATENLKKLQY